MQINIQTQFEITIWCIASVAERAKAFAFLACCDAQVAGSIPGLGKVQSLQVNSWLGVQTWVSLQGTGTVMLALIRFCPQNLLYCYFWLSPGHSTIRDCHQWAISRESFVRARSKDVESRLTMTCLPKGCSFLVVNWVQCLHIIIVYCLLTIQIQHVVPLALSF